MKKRRKSYFMIATSKLPEIELRRRIKSLDGVAGTAARGSILEYKAELKKRRRK